MPEPEGSVVVVTKDRERFLAQTLASLAAQTMSPETVLVTAAGGNTSDDFTMFIHDPQVGVKWK